MMAKLLGTFTVAATIVDAVTASTPDVYDCQVCGSPVFDYEICYNCEQQYYPPRQYWQEVSTDE